MSALDTSRRARIEDEFSNILLSFCPDSLIKHLSDTVPSTDEVAPSRSWTQHGACMLVDISGFTRLSGELCSFGVAGLDELRHVTSSYLSELLHLVYSNGGDVIAFAGDALICVFLDEPNAGGAAESCNKAVSCGYILKDLSYDNKLKCHVAVSYGEMCFAVLDGKGGAKSFLVNGECIHNLSSCIDDANASELVICERTHSYVKNYISSSTELASTNFCIQALPGYDTAVTVDAMECFIQKYQHKLDKLKLRHFADFVPPTVVDAYHSGSFDVFAELREITTVFIKLDTYDHRTHRDLSSLSVFFAMATDALQRAGGHLRQFIIDDKGCVFIAFWGTPTSSFDSNAEHALQFAADVADGCKALHHTCSTGITTGTAYYGTIGSVLRRDLVAIGAPVNFSARLMGKANGRILMDAESYSSLSIKNRAMLETAEPLKLKGFTAPVTPYVVKSEVIINRSCRECDVQARCDRIKRSEMIQSNLDPEITAHITNALEKVEKDYVDTTRNWMSANSESCTAHHNVNLVVIEGDKCSGKSEIANYFYAAAQQRKLRSFFLTALEEDSTLPYSTLVKLYVKLLNNREDELEKKNAHIKKVLCKTYPQLVNDPELLDTYFDKLQCIVTTVLCANFGSEPREVAALCPSRKQLYGACEYAAAILWDVIWVLTETAPTALVLEDFHFVDIMSKEWLLRMNTLKVPVVMMITQRIFTRDENFAEADEGPSAVCECGPVCVCKYKYRFNRYGKIFMNNLLSSKRLMSIPSSSKNLSTSHTTRFTLGSLSMEQTRKIVEFVLYPESACAELPNVDHDRLVNVIRILANGNPHWTFAHASLAKGRVDTFVESLTDELSDDTSFASWPRNAQTLDSPRPPSPPGGDSPSAGSKRLIHLKSHVLSVMNSLTATQNTTIKFASVLGNDFSSTILMAFLPQQSQDCLMASLSVLEELMLVKRSSGIDAAYFHFVTPQVRQIVYDLIPPSDVKTLHEKCAAVCVALTSVPPNIIAYHFFMAYSGPNGASIRDQACHYSLKAALDEVTRMRFAEAFEYFSIAEIVAEEEIELNCKILKNVRETMVLLEELQKDSDTITFYTFIKDAQSIIFGKSNARLNKDKLSELKTTSSSLTDSLSTDSDGSSLDGYVKMKSRLENKLKKLAVSSECKAGPCGEETELSTKRPVGCCTIS